jgi:hypothetical protein
VLEGSDSLLAESAQLFREASTHLEARLGPNHPQVGTTLDRLAGVLIERQAYREALPVSERAVRVLQAANGENHLTTLTAIDRLATIRSGLHQDTEALQLERGVVAAIGRTLGAETGRAQRALQELLRYARLHVARSELISGNRPRADSLLVAIRGDSAPAWRKRERRLLDSLTQVLARH